jgi:hypothetical protein
VPLPDSKVVNCSLRFVCLSDSPHAIVYVTYSTFDVALFDDTQDNCCSGFPDPKTRARKGPEVIDHEK